MKIKEEKVQLNAKEAREETDKAIVLLTLNQFNDIQHKIRLTAMDGIYFLYYSENIYRDNIQKIENLGYKVKRGKLITWN